jgi:hypothetical protein
MLTEAQLHWLRGEFDRCAGWIQEALDRDIGGFLLEDVWAWIADGRAQLWPLKQSAIVTTLDYYPRKVVLRYWLCGGEHNNGLEECTAATDRIEQWAKRAGATDAMIGGRKGWLKVLPGFKENCTVMTKDL